MKKFLEKVKANVKKIKKFVVGIGLMAMSVLTPSVVYAGPAPDPGVTKVTDNIDKLKDVGTTIVGAIGGVVLVYGIVQFALSFKKQDQHGETNAIFTIVAGIIMLAGGVLVGLFT